MGETVTVKIEPAIFLDKGHYRFLVEIKDDGTAALRKVYRDDPGVTIVYWREGDDGG